MKPRNHKVYPFSLLSIICLGMSAQGATFNDGGDGVSWEDPLNWSTGAVPPSSAAENIVILGNSQVVFDADTWSYLSTNGLLHTPTEYRGALRLLMGENTSGSTNGTHSLTLAPGDGNKINFTTGSSQGIGTRPGKNSTLNVLDGIIDIGGNPMNIAGGGNGILNLSGGSIIFGRTAPNIGTSTGNGEVNITGGTFATRSGANIGANGSFNVFGSAATEIGIGSAANLDGVWTQASGGTLKLAIDAGGITKIFVDDTGTGLQAATFDSGSLLDLGFINTIPTSGTWTVLELENGDITDNGLTLAPGVDPSVWSFAVDNSGTNGLLTVTAVIPQLFWDGSVNDDWDVGGTANWLRDGLPVAYSQPSEVTFDDTLTGTGTVNLTTTISDASVLVANDATTYDFTGTGKLSGLSTLTKVGPGTMILRNSGGNDFTGGTIIGEGTLILGTGGSFASTNTLVLGTGGSSGILQLGDVAGAVNTTVTSLTTDTGSSNAIIGGNATTASVLTVNSADPTIDTYAGSLGDGVAGDTDANRLSLVKQGTGALRINSAGTYTGGTTIEDGVLSYGANGAFGTGDVTINGGRIGIGSPGMNLANNIIVGGNFAIGTESSLSGNASGLDVSGNINLGGAARDLTIRRTTNISGVISNGALNLIGVGSGDSPDAGRRMRLLGSNTYLGGTTVTSGILEIDGDSLSDLGNLTLDGGTVDVTGSGNETVNTLTIGGNVIFAGTYSNADHPEIVGGQITVLNPPVPNGYNTWAAANAGGQGPEEDFDGDGVENGVEFFLDAPAGFTANPGLVSGTVTWPNGGNIDSGEYGTQFLVQTSSNLSTWDDVLDTDPNLSNTAGAVSYTPTDAAPFFIRLVVTPTLPVE